MSDIIYEIDRKENDGCHLHGEEPITISVDLCALWRWGKKKLKEKENEDDRNSKEVL